MRAVPNKAQKWVFEQLLVVRRLLPFVHSDNGGEFIRPSQRYCEQQQIWRALPRASQERSGCREQFAAIDPIALNDQIMHLQRRLLRLAAEHASPLARVG